MTSAILPLLEQILAAVILLAGISLSYWFLVRPLGRLNLQQTGALLLTLLALNGGLIGSFFWWFDVRESFSWDLPPLASRMLAAAAFSFFVLCLLALRRPTFRSLRLVMLALFVYLVPLAAVIVLFHLDRFDPAAPITYAFFLIVLTMCVASTWYLFRPVRIAREGSIDNLPLSPISKAWMTLVAIVTGLWGLALFATDAGPSPLIWAWPGDLLSSRLISVMLITICVGSLYSLRDVGTARLMMAMTITYSIGLAAASLWNLTAGKPVKSLYVIVFGLIFLGSVLLRLFDRRFRPARAYGTEVTQ